MYVKNAMKFTYTKFGAKMFSSDMASDVMNYAYGESG